MAPALEEAGPEPLDLQRILPDDHLAQVGLDDRRIRRARTEPGEPLVGEDLDVPEDALLVAVPAVAVRARTGTEVAVDGFDVGDSHPWLQATASAAIVSLADRRGTRNGAITVRPAWRGTIARAPRPVR